MRDVSDIKDMRDALMAAIIDLAKEHPEVVFLDSDLSSCIKTKLSQLLKQILRQVLKSLIAIQKS